ncbi:B3/B4 domain-containing protein [Coprobacter tertius]|uniref:Phenylalanine--tRNA ligase beta subunit-related protein n=1 Tax=Coprobacter tertius TaxID=2944915 RepID=A0ABT1MGP5_9BACT|nr:phenylalanine--tRNA ligase beta subunit-related protein [Coprobacter tertius]MCP9610853.1 phenylalanine--tRNA ligase beta subunit-related protein [Coprobacter tertius]
MTGIKVTVSEKFLSVCPQFDAAVITAKVHNSALNPRLWQEIDAESRRIKETYTLPDINKREAIRSTRAAYKALGKDPNRYRPSAEALCRRIVKGMELYRISTLVDLINLVSMHTGFSIGGFDAEKINGDLILGVGNANEEFQGIGRGLLNIEGLPVYRDRTGPIGTPTSDEERTKLTLATREILIIINAYSGGEQLGNAVRLTGCLLTEYADAKELSYTEIFK